MKIPGPTAQEAAEGLARLQRAARAAGYAAHHTESFEESRREPFYPGLTWTERLACVAGAICGTFIVLVGAALLCGY